MRNKWKKLLAGTLAAAMVMGMLSVGALAEEELDLTPAVIEQVDQEVPEADEVKEEVKTDLPEETEEAGEPEEPVQETPAESEEPAEEVILDEEPILAPAPELPMVNTMAAAEEEEACEHDWVYVSCDKLYTTMCFTLHNDNMECSKCGATTVKSTGVGGHSHHFVVTGDAVDTGITNNRHTVECTNCTAVETREHSFAPATCVTREVCVCGYEKRESAINPDNHVNVVTNEAVPATCTTPGKTEGSHCADCNKVLVKQEETPLASHTVVIDEAVSVTCTTPGKTAGSHCSVCNTVLEKQEEIESVGHKWGEGVVTKAPTEGEPGEMTFTCAECRTTKTEPIAWEPPVVAMIKENEKKFTTLQAAVTAAIEGETVILLVDVTENVTATNKTITLDLNGKTVNGGNNGTVLTINGGNVTLDGNGTITGGAGAKHGGGVKVDQKGNFTMNSGTITGNSATEWGGGVCIDEGTFTMNGGLITENSALHLGGGVAVYNYLENKSALFTMNDGTISYNESASGGGVGAYGWKHLNGGRTVAILNGGTIDHNTVVGDGGGVAVQTADYYAGATYLHTIKIGNVQITNNTANQGGGIYSIESLVEVVDTKITGNTATGISGQGGGIMVSSGEISLADVTITGNSAVKGGGLFANHNSRETEVTMTSGKLYGNTASSHSADVYCDARTTLTLPAASEMGGTLNDKNITGWFWDENPRWSADNVNDHGTISEATGKQCLIAAYDPRFTLTYTDGMNGQLFADQVYKVLGGEKAPAFEGTLERDGYVFAGWIKGTSLVVDTDELIIEKDTVLYPKWEKARYTLTVKYIFQDQKGNILEERTVSTERLEAGYEYTVAAPAMKGYTTANTTVKGSLNKDTTVTVTYTKDPDPVVPQPELVSLIWLDGYNKGTEATIKSITIEVRGEYEAPADPTRTGYVFNGWSEGVESENSDGRKVITYTAQWVKTFTVTYTDGVEGAELFADQTKTVKTGEATPAFEGTPTREGYTFNGWNPEVAETVTADVTYVAQWTRNSTGGGTTGGGDDDDDDRPTRPTPTPTPSEEPTTPVETPEVEDLPEEDVPLAQQPEETETLTDEEVPLAGTPEALEDLAGTSEALEDLGEMEVPLAQVPETGDSLGLWLVMAICSLFGLAWLGKKQEA